MTAPLLVRRPSPSERVADVLPADSYELPCANCQCVTVWALLVRIGRQTTYVCRGCGKLRVWRQR